MDEVFNYHHFGWIVKEKNKLAGGGETALALSYAPENAAFGDIDSCKKFPRVNFLCAEKSRCGFFFLLLRSILDSNVKRIRVSYYDQSIWIKPKIGLGHANQLC